MPRLSHLLTFAATALLGSLAAPSTKPHLFFFLVDDLGFNDFSFRSSDLKDVAWPKVGALLNESIIVEHYYTQPLCTPTRAALMSGRFPARLGLQHGVIAGNLDYGLPLHEVTLADKLKDAGYATHAVGKWHLGNYNFESTPTYRGFDTYLGYWSGAEDYYTHVVGGSHDFHRQWNKTEPGQGTYQKVTDEDGVFSTPVFEAEMSAAIRNHKKNFDGQPGFFYLPLQNVHVPLESPGGKYDDMCADVPNAYRKTFCAMAAAADDAIGNLTTLIAEQFAGEEYLVVISGDNGGIPTGAGNNWPLRGHKAELWEGGIRNNAVVWGSLVPESKRGSTYDQGLVHVTDWHATFVELAQATLAPYKALDGQSVWGALTTGAASPMTEFLVNYDPCSGHGTCSGIEWGYREGDLKLMYGVANDTWYPVPTSATSQLESSAVLEHSSGDVWWPEEHYKSAQPNRVASDGVSLTPACVAAVKKACPDGTILCSQCIKEHWSDISQGCTQATEEHVSDYMCYGITVYLYNISADPSEQTNLLDAADGAYDETVSRIQAKVQAIVDGGDYMAPPNVPGGSCASDDPNAAAVISAHGEIYPWVNDTTK